MHLRSKLQPCTQLAHILPALPAHVVFMTHINDGYKNMDDSKNERNER